MSNLVRNLGNRFCNGIPCKCNLTETEVLVKVRLAPKPVHNAKLTFSHVVADIYELPHEKPNNLQRLKQSRRSAAVTANLISTFFVFATWNVQSLNFELLAVFCGCTAWVVSDLFKNHTVGFLMRWLIYIFFRLSGTTLTWFHISIKSKI